MLILQILWQSQKTCIYFLSPPQSTLKRLESVVLMNIFNMLFLCWSILAHIGNADSFHLTNALLCHAFNLSAFFGSNPI